jgi:hypothetical protein
VPYLRLYSPDVPLAQKRLIAQRLIQITLRAFRLRAEDRHRINVQFVSVPSPLGVASLQPVIPPDADFLLEVNDQGLTEEKKRTFAEEVTPMLTQELGVQSRAGLAQPLGMKTGISPQVALQFNELNPDELTRWDSSFLLQHQAA